MLRFNLYVLCEEPSMLYSSYLIVIAEVRILNHTAVRPARGSLYVTRK